MKYKKALFITDLDKELDGKVIYTNNLVKIFSGNSEKLDIVCFDKSFLENEGGKVFEIKKKKGLVFIRYFLSFLPMMACRTLNKEYKTFLRNEIDDYDLFIINHHSMLWASKYISKESKLVFVTHNIETKVALSRVFVNKGIQNIIFSYVDFIKHFIYEKKYIRKDFIITTISKYDLNYYGQKLKNKVIKLLPFSTEEKKLTDFREKEVVIVGSFFWKLKKDNLLKFLEEAYSMLNAASVSIKIIGGMDHSFNKQLVQSYPDLIIRSNVDKIDPEIKHSRIGLIIDKAGGGFKLKVIDYIRFGLPIFSINEGITEDVHGETKGYIKVSDYKKLTKCILEEIDDIDSLKSRQNELILENQHFLNPYTLEDF